MAVVDVREIMDGRSGKGDRLWQVHFTRVWLIQTNSAYDGPMTVALSLPVVIGSHYKVVDGTGTTVEENNFALVTDLDIKCTSDDGLEWTCTVNYGPYDPNTFGFNPLDHPLRISWTHAKYELAVDQEIPDPSTGEVKAVINSAGDSFDPPPTRDDSRPLLKIVKNLATYDPLVAHDWKDAINSDSWNGFDEFTVKAGDISGDLRWAQGTGFYYEVTYEFEVNPDGWRKKILDQGVRTLDSATNKQSNILDEKGQPVTTAVLLDGSGQKLTSGDDPVFLEFHIYNEKAFADLDLTLTGNPGQ